jgi:hypothetical protein
MLRVLDEAARFFMQPVCTAGSPMWPAERFAPDSRRLNLGKYLQQISVGIAKEQRAMSKGLVGGRRDPPDALAHQFAGAPIDLDGGP